MLSVERSSCMYAFRAAALIVAAMMLCVMGAPRNSNAAEGVSYTLTPVYNAIQWEDGLGLEDAELLGGRLAYDFGRYVSLQGYYLGRDNVSTRLGRTSLAELPGVSFIERDVNIRNYGADIVLNLGTTGVTPFIRGGGGVLRLDPADGERVDLIAVKAGGGFRFGLDRLNAVVFVEDTAFRMNRFDLAGPGTWPDDPDMDEVRHNLSFGAGINLKLGGQDGGAGSETDRAVSERFRRGLSGLSVPVEPFVGRLDFNDDLRLARQDVLGVRTGVDLGRYVGLRGYWWTGMNDSFDDTMPISSYGAEAQFNLGTGEGTIPYLIGGVGQLDFEDDFVDKDGLNRTDRTMLILGGGLALRVGDRFRVNVDLRDHLMGDDDLQDLAAADDLVSSWMIGAGVTFNLFGSSPDGRRGLLAKEEPVHPAVVPEAAVAVTPVEAAAPAIAEAVEDDTVRVAEVTTEDLEVSPPAGTEAEEVVLKEIHRDYSGERTVTIPVPTEGEIYIRYGRPGAVTIQSLPQEGGDTAAAGATTVPIPGGIESPDSESLRALIRDELRRGKAAQAGGAAVTVSDLEAMEARLAERIDSRIDQGMVKVARAEGPERTVIVSAEGQVVEHEPYRWKLLGFRPYTGVNVDDPEQFVIGSRFNLGPVTRNSRLVFEPEFALGFGSDVTTTLIAANLTWSLPKLDSAGDWRPFLSAGLGIINYSRSGPDDTDVAFNPSLGVAGQIDKWKVYSMYQGVSLFDLNRILIGVRLGE